MSAEKVVGAWCQVPPAGPPRATTIGFRQPCGEAMTRGAAAHEVQECDARMDSARARADSEVVTQPTVRHPDSAGTFRVRAAAAAAAVLWGYFFFGLIDLAVPIDQESGFYDSYVLETGWGVTYTFLVGAAFLSVMVRPSLTLPLIQVTLVALCLGVTALVSGSLGQLVPAVLLVLNAYGISYLVRGHVRFTRGWYRPPVDPFLAALTILLFAPAAVFAVDMIEGYRTGRAPAHSLTWGVDHWPTQAALALAVVAVAVAVAAGVRGGWAGTAVSAVCVAAAAGWFGVVCTVYPQHAGSIGARWGAALLAWAIVFVAATGWRMVAHHGLPIGEGRSPEGA